MAVILETSLGDLTVDLYTDERPKCCTNFLKLCKIKYYNFCLFHSVQRNLVAQTGDPTGTGKGGSSIYQKLFGEQARYFEAEVKPRIKHKKKGALSMVNNGSNMHGSQFFLTLDENIDYLDGKHTVFGEVAEGFEVLDKMNEAFVDREGRPYQDIRIYHTVILDDPFNDPGGLGEFIPDRSPEPTKEQLDSGRIGVDEEIDDTKGKTAEEVEEMLEEKEAKANAQILEMVGDLPDVDVKPPDTVLFVCKLNPVTTEDDLEIIFSRFGTITNCEVIKDHKTNESLQYAFIEFEKAEDCESAYFKMDNVLIDDRRIHVDFSQSVSKIQWKGKDKKDSDKPQFVIKDRSRKDNYEFVFDEAEPGSSHGNKKSKKKKKKHRHHSSESDDGKHESSKKKFHRDRSRSLSPVYHHHKERISSKREKSNSSKPSKDTHSQRDNRGNRHSHKDGQDRHNRDRRDRY